MEEENSLKSDQYLELWKHFQDQADHIKERMWTITAWLFALLTGLLGFMASEGMKFGENKPQNWITEPVMVILLAMLGLMVCVYAILMQLAYGYHVRSNWERSNRILKKHPDLKAVFLGEEPIKPTPKHLKDATRLITLTGGFGILMLLVIVLALIELIT